MIRGRNDYPVNLDTIEKVDDEGESYAIKKSDGWSMWIGKSECDGFVPKVGDWILTETPVNNISTIIIEGRVIRHKLPAQVDAEFQQFRKNLRLERLERYVANKDKMEQRVKALPLPLRLRMNRFSEESGMDFWIESADYEMFALEGAAALLRKVQELGYIANVDYPAHEGNDCEGAIKWIEDWWKINSKDHDPPYDYKKQMEIVPDFGDGHSGNTAGAAYALAHHLLAGKDV
jgi:hypothetical protein